MSPARFHCVKLLCYRPHGSNGGSKPVIRRSGYGYGYDDDSSSTVIYDIYGHNGYTGVWSTQGIYSIHTEVRKGKGFER